MSCTTFSVQPVTGPEFIFGDNSATRVRRGVMGMEVPPVDVISLPYLSVDGSALVAERRDAAEMLIPLLLTPDPEGGNISSTVQAINNAFKFGPVTLRADTGVAIRERLNVVYTGGLEGDLSAGSALADTWRKVVLSLRALDPWWYGDTVTFSLAFDEGVAFDDSGTAFDSSSVNFDGVASQTAGLGGDTGAFPIVTFEGPFTTCYVGKSLSSERVELAGALADGDTITVDSRPGQRGPRLNNGPVDWSLLTPESRLLYLDPNTELSVRLYAAATGDSGSSNVEVSYRKRWATPA